MKKIVNVLIFMFALTFGIKTSAQTTEKLVLEVDLENDALSMSQNIDNFFFESTKNYPSGDLAIYNGGVFQEFNGTNQSDLKKLGRFRGKIKTEVYPKEQKDMMTQLVKFTVKPEFTKAFTEAATKSLHASVLEAGNVEMKLYSDDKKPNVLYVYSRWKDADAYELHKEFSYSHEIKALAGKALASAPIIMKLGETKFAPMHDKNSVNPEDKEEALFFIFKIKDGYREQVIKRFEDHVANTHNEKGNLFFDFYTVDGADDTFVVHENWRNPAAIWKIHMKQPYAEKTGALLNEAVIGNMEDGMNFITEIK
ncbi:putative quinol monooxygenase [Ancylomarina sp. 16SWW S1-10-2]|uniref:putative quinol monooxygenase n=1 Tax=Ancylomarina sp. 16SWW S1-10-2 TaxID=2499681 RepID=UPI0012AE02E5|nr:antibiotic biosynthesis monooxygenase [Ancylomarina sp. 16SWW S1-10-2]MRT92414.1 hypothetical protein [Ancylomarina sp. 16SWW S1-10-2]